MALNPVERRLVQLREHWENFRADDSKRLLIWRVPGNAVRLTECFFETQKYEAEYSSRDLFIVFEQPFEHSIQYSRALKEALKGQYDATRDDLVRQGIAADWAFDPDAFPDSATGFIQSLRQFGSKHHQHVGHLVAVLNPSQVTNPVAYAGWLTRCLAAALPPRLRLLAVDTAEAPRLESVTPETHPLVAFEEPPLDALATAQETFAQEAAVGPAAVFRNYLMGLVTLVEKGSADQVKAKAGDALAFARKQGWSDQEVVVGTLVAGALLKEKRFDDAVAIYQAAGRAATKVAESGHPSGHQLVLQTLFGEAGALLAAGELDRAAARYDEAAALARRIQSRILAIEASRMGMFCHARAERRDAAILRGRQALNDAQTLKPESRPMTSLPIAAVDLLRVVDAERLRGMEDIKARLSARVDALHDEAEAKAVLVERSIDPSRATAVGQNLTRAVEEAHAQAGGELSDLAATGSDQFRQVFASIRTLFGPAWPVAFLEAIPHVRVEATATADAGVPA